MNKKYILGIDPGKSGGMAFVSNEETIAYSFKHITYSDISDIITSKRSEIKKAYIEKVASMPKQGVKSMFVFGESYGYLQGILTASLVPFERVLPAKWQKSLSCLSKGDKNVTKQRAQELFPLVDKITHATADALLIAEYGRRDKNGTR